MILDWSLSLVNLFYFFQIKSNSFALHWHVGPIVIPFGPIVIPFVTLPPLFRRSDQIVILFVVLPPFSWICISVATQGVSPRFPNLFRHPDYMGCLWSKLRMISWIISRRLVHQSLWNTPSRELLLLTPVGSRWRVYLPYHLLFSSHHCEISFVAFPSVMSF